MTDESDRDSGSGARSGIEHARTFTANLLHRTFSQYLNDRHLYLSPIVMASASLYGAMSTDSWALYGTSVALSAVGIWCGISLNRGKKYPEVFGDMMGVALVSMARGPISFALAGNLAPLQTTLFKLSGAAVVLAIAYNKFGTRFPWLQAVKDFANAFLRRVDPSRREPIPTSSFEQAWQRHRAGETPAADRQSSSVAQVFCKPRPVSEAFESAFGRAALRHLRRHGDQQEPPPHPASS